MAVVLALAVLLLGAAAIVFLPLYLARFRRELSRSEEIADVARSLGLAFSRDDPAFPSRSDLGYPFELFSRGVDQRCENVVTGRYGGADVRVFDFWWIEELGADEAEPSRRGTRVESSRTCALVPFDGDAAWLRVSPQSTADRLERGIGVEELELEWNDFNAAFHIHTADRKSAVAFLDPAMMAWLYDRGRAWTWEVQGGYVLCHSARRDPETLHDTLDALVGVRDRIPRGVLAAP